MIAARAWGPLQGRGLASGCQETLGTNRSTSRHSPDTATLAKLPSLHMRLIPWRRHRKARAGDDARKAGAWTSASAPQPRSEAEARELRLALLRESYSEVLDATTHQDEKIGRLLTAIAFLTGASLALAGLSGSNHLLRPYTLGPFEIPLALVTIGAFVLWVSFAVMLLLAAFSTPLQIPGFGDPARPRATVKPEKIHQIYFFGIIRHSEEEWGTHLDSPVDDLVKWRIDSFKREVHNLAARAAYKHDRVTEASTLIAQAIVWFALSGLLIVISAAKPPRPNAVALSAADSFLIGAVIAAACYMQFHVRIRDLRKVLKDKSNPVRLGVDRTFSISTTLGVLLVLSTTQPLIVTTILVGTAGLLAVSARIWAVIHNVTDASDAPTRQKRKRDGLIQITFALTAAAASTFVAANHDVGPRIIVALTIYLLVTTPSLFNPTSSAEQRLSEARRRRDEKISTA